MAIMRANQTDRNCAKLGGVGRMGLVVACASIAAAILLRFPYWYTPCTIGSFLFYDAVAERLGTKSTRGLLKHGHGGTIVAIYVIATSLGLAVDVFYGRFLTNAWVYPALTGFSNIAVPVLFEYPFGFLSLYMSFRVLQVLMGVSEVNPRPLPHWWHRVSTVALFLCFATPIVNLAFNGNRNAGELLFVIMVVGTLAFDGVHDALTGTSILSKWVAGGWRFGAAIVIAIVWAVILNEGPNVRAQEWTYLIRPWGLPLWLILVLGWLFLLSVSAAAYEVPLGLKLKGRVRFQSPHADAGRGAYAKSLDDRPQKQTKSYGGD